MAIEICRIGNSDWPRYVLVHHASNGPRYWKGDGWAAELSGACLYAVLPEACREFERLQTKQVGGRFVQEFEARITVKLQADHALSEQELARFLDRFAELFLPTDGPTHDSLVQAEIHWHELRERVQNKSSNHSKDETTE